MSLKRWSIQNTELIRLIEKYCEEYEKRNEVITRDQYSDMMNQVKKEFRKEIEGQIIALIALN
ncbi:hypothetical protein HYS50_02425 [Candidatus Woesearchaeota archaeon]|nr:hypothetical protein [Candidatus Woesearchaeota archaeon]